MPAPTAIRNYSGPAKLVLTNNGTLVPMMSDNENGPINLAFNFPRFTRATGSQGYLLQTLNDASAKITLTPFDSWLLLPTMYPPMLGVTTAAGTGSGAGALKIGSHPFDYYGGGVGGCASCLIWTPDGRLYNMVRNAIIKPPSLKLGVGQPLFSSIEIASLTDPVLQLGVGGELIDITLPHIAGTAGVTGVIESAAVDPASWTPDFVNGHWSGVFGTAAGFGGDGGLAMDAEDGFELIATVKYSPIVMQKRTMNYKLDSVMFGVKARLQGPTHTALMALSGGYGLGAMIGGGTLATPTKTSLILTGPQGKTVTLPDCVPIFDNSGFDFGGTKLNTGDVVFVTRALPSGNPAVPPVLLQFSA